MTLLKLLPALALAACIPALAADSPAAPATPASAVIKPILDYARDCQHNSQSTVCIESIAHALRDAHSYLSSHGSSTYVIQIPPGTFDFSDEPRNGGKAMGKNGDAAIDVSGISPHGGGRLILQGYGKDLTTLISPIGLTGITGESISHITFAYMTLTRPRLTVSQGVIVDSTVPGQLTMDVPAGFPTPLDIYDPDKSGRRYLRVYTNSKTDPQLVLTPTNGQITWGYRDGTPKPPTPVADHAGRWIMYLDHADSLAGPDYAPGMLACVKSKAGEGQAYLFNGRGSGGDIVFDNIRWINSSRGAFRGGLTGIKILNSEVRRAPAINGQVPCLATPGGGPQIGQPHDPPTHGNLVENYYAEGTGDDAVAFFNDDSVPGTPTASIVRHVNISNSFAREILLANSCGVTVQDAHVVGCGPLLGDCPATHVGGPCGLPDKKDRKKK